MYSEKHSREINEINMELILISKSKLKIMLDALDMKKYRIETDTVTAMRRGFRPVLEKAGAECGFDIKSGRLIIKVFPSRDGGCEMFVTRVVDSSAMGELEFERVGECDEMVYLFPSLSTLISACVVLSARGYNDESLAYALEDGRCALILPRPKEDGLGGTLSVLNEYGERVSDGSASLYIKECGVPICPHSPRATTALVEFSALSSLTSKSEAVIIDI